MSISPSSLLLCLTLVEPASRDKQLLAHSPDLQSDYKVPVTQLCLGPTAVVIRVIGSQHRHRESFGARASPRRAGWSKVNLSVL